MIDNREPMISFSWRRDADGYVLDGGRIVRRGGRMVEYCPDELPFPLHRCFADIMSQTWAGAENEGRQLSEDPSAPFYMRGFDDMPKALLAFVTEYGFIGSDRTGDDAESEDLPHLMKQVSELRMIKSWASVMGRPHSRAPGKIVGSTISVHEPKTGKTVKRFKPKTLYDALLYIGVEQSLSGPNLRMVFAAGGPHGRLQMRYVPESLYAWMWMRTAGDLTTGVDWSGAPCLFCMAPIGRGPGAHRRDAKFCSDTHRTYFARLSKREQQRRRSHARAMASGHNNGGE